MGGAVPPPPFPPLLADASTAASAATTAAAVAAGASPSIADQPATLARSGSLDSDNSSVETAASQMQPHSSMIFACPRELKNSNFSRGSVTDVNLPCDHGDPIPHCPLGRAIFVDSLQQQSQQQPRHQRHFSNSKSGGSGGLNSRATLIQWWPRSSGHSGYQ
jgi:hypothetical protein